MLETYFLFNLKPKAVYNKIQIKKSGTHFSFASGDDINFTE